MNKKRILIVDDELSVRLTVKKTLERDYTVIEAEDGEQAIDVAHTESPDLILMDIMMPKLDGVGACNIIKSRSVTKSIPIIMLTGLTHTLDKEYSRTMGADGYLTKPFKPQELRAAICYFLTDHSATDSNTSSRKT